jgi:2-oxo-4-hydroxy-4-carboxy-5-ureidoimidazoline decarboxylase
MSAFVKLNALSKEEAQKAFYQCCSSTVWATQMVSCLPFKTEDELFQQADKLWNCCKLSDYLEAFSHHPRIGGNVASLREKYEQKGVEGASNEVLEALSSGNTEYESKFGFVFLICATGKSATEMLEFLKKRLPNTTDQEILNAKAEQAKITQIRLKKLLQEL